MFLFRQTKICKEMKDRFVNEKKETCQDQGEGEGENCEKI